MDIKHADSIRRIDVPPEDRTEKRDQAAELIEEMWGPDITFKDIAKKSEERFEKGFSRQHVSNTLRRYFEPAEESRSSSSNEARTDEDLPEDTREYLMGYRQGYKDGWRDAREQ